MCLKTSHKIMQETASSRVLWAGPNPLAPFPDREGGICSPNGPQNRPISKVNPSCTRGLSSPSMPLSRVSVTADAPVRGGEGAPVEDGERKEVSGLTRVRPLTPYLVPSPQGAVFAFDNAAIKHETHGACS